MSKKISISDNVMTRIKSGEVGMKPRWYYIAGSIGMLAGLVGVIVTSVFSIRILLFSLRTHGPMGEVRFQQLISNFPVWALFLGIIGIIVGIKMLKKYDFSYKNNFLLIVVGFILAILLSGFLIDKFNLDKFVFGNRFGGGIVHGSINSDNIKLDRGFKNRGR